jgi:excisionase family DNA binding protein
MKGASHPPGERLALRFSEAAEMLGVSPDTVSRMARRGEIPCVWLRGAPRIPLLGLREWLDTEGRHRGQTDG